MSTSQSTKGIQNASEIIERFGGIRPMAKKIDVAVTTIQGWKKRDVIPANRLDAIIKAAANNDIKITDLVANTQNANENTPEKGPEELTRPIEEQIEEKTEKTRQQKEAAIPKPPQSETQTEEPQQGMMSADEFNKKLQEIETKAITKSTWIAIALMLLGLGAVIVLLWGPGKIMTEEERLSALEHNVGQIENDVQSVKKKQSFFGTLIPEDLGDQMDSLRQQAENAQTQLSNALSKAQEVSNDVLGENAGNIEQRLSKLEHHVSDMVGSQELSSLLSRINTLSLDASGQAQLQKTMDELGAVFASLNNAEAPENTESAEEQTIEAALQEAVNENPALNETFAGIPPTDLKAAALLVGMSQLRASLNRDEKPFDKDLEVLMNMVAEEDPDLHAALERLAPYAEQGILSPSGLTDEFKSMAGDAMVASLSGEDVSLQDRAKARLNDIFQVEKNGELVTGTETQATLQKAENLLENGRLEDAITQTQSLEGPAAELMQNWINQANATLWAEKIKALLDQSINTSAYGQNGITAQGGANGITATGNLLPGQTQLIRNKELGINILKENKSFKPPADANPYD